MDLDLLKILKSVSRTMFLFGAMLLSHDSLISGADLYWNGGTTAANPAAGGTGTWSTTNAWRTGSATGTQATWAAATGGTDNAFLAGTAGTITLGTSGTVNFTGANMTVSTSGYSITSTNNSRNLVFTGTLTLAENVGLIFDLNSTGQTWGFGTIHFATGSSLTIQGIATASNANRVNLSTAGTISGGTITLAGAATGATGFVSTATIASGGVILNTNITNNSATSATMLGATGGNLLTYGGQISGNSSLQISAGGSGGAGIVVLANQSSYTGDTYTNTGTNAVIRIGVDNALPTGTTVFMGASAGGGTADTGGSIDLNGFNLAIGGLEAGSSTRGIANNTAALSTLTIGKATGTNTFGGVIGTVTNTTLTTQSGNIELLKTGGSTQILGGANSYTGNTFINSGTIRLATGNNRLPIGTVVSLGQAASDNVGTLDLNGFNQEIAGLNSTAGTNATASNNTVTSASAVVLTINNSLDASYGDGTNANSGVITGAISLVKTGAGTQTLGDTNTYSGTTTVNQGTLIINGDQSGAMGNVTVSANATLGGDGIIGGDTTISGNLRVGSDSSVGTTGSLDFSAENLSFASGSTWFIDIVGAASDSLTGIDVFSIDPAATLSFNFSSPTAQSYTLASYASRANPSDTFSGFANGHIFSGYQINYTDTAITLTAIPEPGTIGLLGLFLAGVFYHGIRVRRQGVLRDVS